MVWRLSSGPVCKDHGSWRSCPWRDGNVEEAGCALKHTLVWLKKCVCWTQIWKGLFFHVFSLHVHTFSKEISESALCCWQCHQEHWSASQLPIQPADHCALSTVCSSGALSRVGIPLSFRSSACHPNRSSLSAAEGSRRSVLFFISQSSILLAFSQFPFKQHNPAEGGKPAAESEVKGMWWVPQQLEASLTGSFSLLTASAVMCKDEGEF